MNGADKTSTLHCEFESLRTKNFGTRLLFNSWRSLVATASFLSILSRSSFASDLSVQLIEAPLQAKRIGSSHADLVEAQYNSKCLFLFG